MLINKTSGYVAFKACETVVKRPCSAGHMGDEWTKSTTGTDPQIRTNPPVVSFQVKGR